MHVFVLLTVCVPCWAFHVSPCAGVRMVCRFPTILNLAGAPIPTDRPIDGVDMQDVLFGTGPSKREFFLYFEWRTARLVAVSATRSVATPLPASAFSH